jgi:hypothetical protein
VSNFLAIATVTAALREALQPAVGSAVSGATVGFNRPDGAGEAPPTPAVNVYLYQVTPNVAYRNNDLPTRRPDVTVTQRPQAAFDLHYLFTFHGNDAKLEPQLLLGAVASTLHAQPLISQTAINKVVSEIDFLKGSNFNQVERVKFTPASLNLEEFSKLWSVFFQIEYSLSAVYQASVVLIESADEPHPTLPVQTRNLSLLPFLSPYIDRVVSQAGVNEPILSGAAVLIQGRQFKGGVTLVLIDGQELIPDEVKETQVTVKLPATIRAGAKGVQVIQVPVAQKNSMGTLSSPQRSLSNLAAFVLHPVITGTPTATGGAGVTSVTLDIAPNIGLGQRAILILNNLAVTPAVTFTSAPVVSKSDSSRVTIDISGVPAGSYLVRVQINGAESPLAAESTNKSSGPTVAMP